MFLPNNPCGFARVVHAARCGDGRSLPYQTCECCKDECKLDSFSHND